MTERAVTEVVELGEREEPTHPPAVAPLQLVCVAGRELGQIHRLTSASLLIGRAAAEIVLASPEVSRSHARIERDAGGYVVTDLGSANGTFVNGVRVTGSAPLRVGDRLQVGTTIFVLGYHDELEERMRQLQRVQAMGTMAGGLAHDFNNALAVVLSNLELVAERVEDPELRELLGEMRDSASAAAQLAQRLLRLGRTEPPAFEPVRLAGLVERAVSATRRQAGGKLDLAAAVAPDLAVAGSYEELHQVLVNLLLNARDAMPGGGSVRIHARPVRLDPVQATAHQLAGGGDFVEVAIVDTGCGMDAATLARIFEPFFTTKPPGSGTGLGLAMVHGIVRRHGGAIDVESAPGRGTTFRILLPAAG